MANWCGRSVAGCRCLGRPMCFNRCPALGVTLDLLEHLARGFDGDVAVGVLGKTSAVCGNDHRPDQWGQCQNQLAQALGKGWWCVGLRMNARRTARSLFGSA
jgi:hypothetical protein